jgi:Tol biopolymer transport system component
MLLIALAAISSATAASPAGPRLAVMKWGAQPQRLQLLTMAADGSDMRAVHGRGLDVRPLPHPTAGLSWSPDGERIAFVGVAGADRQFAPRERRVFLIPADGGQPLEVPGTAGATGPVFSPDGRTIAFARERIRVGRTGPSTEAVRYESATTWLVDLGGGPPRRLTRWRDGLENRPASFSPDGSTLALSRTVGDARRESIAMSLDGRGSVVLVRNGFVPVYSPDGAEFAFLRGKRRTFEDDDGSRTTALMTDLYVRSIGDGKVRQLTDTPTTIDISPGWDPSGTRLVYTALPKVFEGAGFFGFGDSVMTVNVDGTCRQKVLSKPRWALFGAAWRPGAGRESGAVAC